MTPREHRDLLKWIASRANAAIVCMDEMLPKALDDIRQKLAQPPADDATVERSEIDEAITGLVTIHRRLLLEIQKNQQGQFPVAIWDGRQAWDDCGSLLLALVELERAKAAIAAMSASGEEE